MTGGRPAVAEPAGSSGVSKSAADRIIALLAPWLARQQRKRFRKDTVLIMGGALVPTRDHQVAEQSKNHRYSTNHQVVIDADTRLVVAVGQPLPGNRNDCKAWELSGAKDAVGKTTVIAEGGCLGTGPMDLVRTEPGAVRHRAAALLDPRPRHRRGHAAGCGRRVCSTSSPVPRSTGSGQDPPVGRQPVPASA
ncbi:hypothetical protein ACE1SV_62080 [Streptomyces sennicomposti]